MSAIIYMANRHQYVHSSFPQCPTQSDIRIVAHLSASFPHKPTPGLSHIFSGVPHTIRSPGIHASICQEHHTSQAVSVRSTTRRSHITCKLFTHTLCSPFHSHKPPRRLPHISRSATHPSTPSVTTQA